MNRIYQMPNMLNLKCHQSRNQLDMRIGRAGPALYLQVVMLGAALVLADLDMLTLCNGTGKRDKFKSFLKYELFALIHTCYNDANAIG